MTSAPSATATRADPDDPTVLVGHVIAERYRVEAVLGRGGMGAVLRCHHLGLRRDVAVKLLHPELGKDREIAARFEREAASASRLDHPNCVRVLDFGAWQPHPDAPAAKYLAMQLLEGRELSELLGQPLPPARAIALMRQILAGLDHAHAHGVIHRDLKPENVFVTTDHDGAEVLKLVDFGIAKVQEPEGEAGGGGVKLTRVGFVFGTPMYMSPEQAAGGVVDARTDLYAAGVILYEMLAGIPPFQASDPTSLLRQHLFDDPPPLSEALPRALRAVVARTLEKDRERRFGSARELDTALAAIESELGNAPAAASQTTAIDAGTSRMTLRPPTPTLPSTLGATLPRPRRWPWIAGGVGVVGAIVLAKWPREPEPPPPPTEAAQWLAKVVAPPPPAESGRNESTPSKVLAVLPLPVVGAPDTPALDTAEALAAVDAAIARGDRAEALGRLDTMLLAQPDDAALLLRRARLLATMPDRGAEALDAFATAIARDADALESETTRDELLALARRPALRVHATEVAIAGLGELGVPLLLEFVAAPKPVLELPLRHRALERIAADGEHADEVDVALQQSLDLWQAAQAPAPCEQFGTTLDAIAAAPSPGVLGTLHRVTPPAAPADADAQTQQSCVALPARLQAVRTAVLAAHPVPAAQWTVPPAYANAGKKKPAKKKGFLKRLFGG
ncbi:MAG: serine/threonine-protein kinase [Nannocystaceae bacterium]